MPPKGTYHALQNAPKGNQEHGKNAKCDHYMLKNRNFLQTS